jgi:hypothetical protein
MLGQDGRRGCTPTLNGEDTEESIYAVPEMVVFFFLVFSLFEIQT